MTRETLARMIDGQQYGDEITKSQESLAKKSGLLVVFGASDDLLEFRGDINGEIGAYGGTEAFITKRGLLPKHERCECGFCGYAKVKAKATRILACWSKGEFSWEISTSIPYSTFKIYEGEEKYCRGIVIDMKDVK